LACLRDNPQLWLSVSLAVGAGIAIHYEVSQLAGALAGAAATLFGTWITSLNVRRAAAEDATRKQNEAQKFLAPELFRMIRRVLYIHERACVNFVCEVMKHDIKPNDKKEDFLPYWPVLYPDTSHFKDLSAERAYSLVIFYDSLATLDRFVNDWWQREDQQPINIYNSILHSARECLELALSCIETFNLDEIFPSKQPTHPTLEIRVRRSLESEAQARVNQMARAQTAEAR
jgi:hypothetical protein